MEHLALEVFDREGTGSKFAVLPENTSITIRRTSQLFGSGALWTYDFRLNIAANAHIFGTAGEIHGSRLHEQINKRKARLWADGAPMYLGYLRLGDEVEVDNAGNVDVSFESGQKTFEGRIEGTSAREVSVGDVVIGVALNRKRVVKMMCPQGACRLEGLEPYAVKDSRLAEAARSSYTFHAPVIPGVDIETPYAQRWPKMMKSKGKVYNSSGGIETPDYTNVQTPYDSTHPFCNINVCYQMKVNKLGEDVVGRGYTARLGNGKATTDGGDNQTRYNNAPNFYLLYFVDRLFKDLGIHIIENQAYDVEDLRRVFMLNYGCHYEEIENNDYDSPSHLTETGGSVSRYGQYYMPMVDDSTGKYLIDGWDKACMQIQSDKDVLGKVLVRDVKVIEDGVTLLEAGSIEGIVSQVRSYHIWTDSVPLDVRLSKTELEERLGAYSAYLAYATGDNYPDVEISEIINAMKSMFGVRFLFSDDYSTVRIVLLRNVFRNTEVQNIVCDIVDDDIKVENNKRGFRMTYGKGTDNTSFYYKGFSDMFPRAATTWKDTTDKHDYSRWWLAAEYSEIKQFVSAMNKTCYVTPVNGNAYAVKIDEENDVLYPSLFEVAPFMDAEDGDCSGESETIEEIQIGATPAVMNEVGPTYASLFAGDMKAPTPDDSFDYAQKIATFARITNGSYETDLLGSNSQTHKGITVRGKVDIYISEGYQIRMKDNYSIGNAGTPFDEADAGLQFCIMRGSGEDARVIYFDDPDDDENGDRDTWEIVPGSGAIDHSDTCDGYGKLWDYNGELPGIGSEDRVSLKLRAEKPNPLYKPSNTVYSNVVKTAAEAAQAMQAIFTTSNADLLNRKRVSGSAMRAAGWTDFTGDYATVYSIQRGIEVKDGIVVEILFTPIRPDGTVLSPTEFERYLSILGGPYVTDEVVRLADAAWEKLILDMHTTEERAVLLHQLQAIYYADAGESVGPVNIGDVDVAPAYDRYLHITNEKLRERGLCDKFYKEYSFWIRNARIVKRTVRMTLAQLMAIDDTVRVRVGDVTGFIKEMKYRIDMQTGLGNVVMEIMYI